MQSAHSTSRPDLQAVILTKDLRASAEAYQRLLSLSAGSYQSLSVAQATNWQAPALAGAKVLDLCTAEGDRVLWLVESDSAQAADPFRRAGWLALELINGNLDQVLRQLNEGPFRLLAQTDAKLSVTGPNDEILHLVLQPGRSPHITLAVANVPDVQAALACYQSVSEDALCTNRALRHINRAWGFVRDREHPVAEVALDEQRRLQLNELKAARIAASTELFCGLFMICIQDPLQPGARVYRGQGGERLLC